MRTWHRRLSIFVAVFMAFIAATGAVLQGEMMMDSGRKPMGPPPGGPSASAALSDEALQALFASALAGARRQTQGTVLGVELRAMGDQPTAEVVVAEPQMRKMRLNARTGAPLDDASAPGGRDLHGLLLELHRGAFAGNTGLWISLVCGVVLTVLSLTGLWLYVQMFLRRRTQGRAQVLW